MKHNPIFLSNLNVFEEIAKAAFEEMKQSLNEHRKPKPGGGFILRFDPDRKSAFTGSSIFTRGKLLFEKNASRWNRGRRVH